MKKCRSHLLLTAGAEFIPLMGRPPELRRPAMAPLSRIIRSRRLKGS
jgi:hypothetical protein